MLPLDVAAARRARMEGGEVRRRNHRRGAAGRGLLLRRAARDHHRRPSSRGPLRRSVPAPATRIRRSRHSSRAGSSPRARTSGVAYDQISAPVVSDRDYTVRTRREPGGPGHCRVTIDIANELAPPKVSGIVRLEKLPLRLGLRHPTRRPDEVDLRVVDGPEHAPARLHGRALAAEAGDHLDQAHPRAGAGARGEIVTRCSESDGA